MLCPYCGAEAADTSLQCPRCGTLLRAAEPVEPMGGYPSSPVSPTFDAPVAQYSTDYASGQPPTGFVPPVTYQPPPSSPAPSMYEQATYPTAYPPLSVPPMVASAPPQQQQRHRVSPIWWLTGAVLVLALAVLATQLPIFHKSGAQPAATPTPANAAPPAASTAPAGPASTAAAPPAATQDQAGYTEAQAVNGILSVTGSSRSSLGSALNDLGNCTNIDAAVGVLQRVSSERGDQVTRAQRLDVHALPNGDAIKSTLVEALSDSQQADNAYLAWGRNESVYGCGSDQNKAAGDQASAAATSAKQRFVAAWNPVAIRYGLPTRVETEV
jgi:hypothetical protein